MSGSKSDKKRKSASKKQSKKDSKKKRSKKDVNAPKRAMSAYILFSNENRAKVKQENPDIPFGDVAKVLSKMWRETSEKEQRRYQELARKDKQRYVKELDEYNAAARKSESKKDRKSSKKKHRDSDSEDDSEDDDDDDDDD